MKDISKEMFDAISGAGKSDRDANTSNRGSGSQANNFGKGGSVINTNGGSGYGCVGGARPNNNRNPYDQ